MNRLRRLDRAGSVREVGDVAKPAGQIRHSAFEDLYAFFIGCSMIAMGLVCLRTAGLVTGGVAGIALLVSYVVPLSTGTLFSLINIPFLLFALGSMGRRFTFKTTVASIGISIFSSYASMVIGLRFINPWFAAIFGGTLIGVGILALARHQTGVGGTGVITLWLQKTRGINAGRTQLAIDSTIILASFLVVPPRLVLISTLSSAALSGIMIVFHRPDRYLAH